MLQYRDMPILVLKAVFWIDDEVNLGVLIHVVVICMFTMLQTSIVVNILDVHIHREKLKVKNSSLS